MFGVKKSRSNPVVSFADEVESTEKLLQEEDAEYILSKKRRDRSRCGTVFFVSALILLVILSLFNLAAVIRRVSTKEHHEALPSDFVELSHRPPKHTSAPHHNEVHEHKPFQCGHTVESAIANGCPFDVVSNLWTPPECYNATFATEALQGVKVGTEHGGIGAPEFGLGVWEWYEDEELQHPIKTVDELHQFLLKRDQAGLPLDAFTHFSFHAAHCSYLARVATDGLHRVRAGEKDVWIPDVAADPHHARHCEHVFGEMFRLNANGEAPRKWTQVGFGIAPCAKIS
ncbi:Hypothetical protein R9X50_00101000 [Acrodontium crateriforme]|uniref:Transmembrane protein n=1 Tax=Acrodontium crateriforme TaxID=150365 RepID=A0AAQ3M1A3_9PEZI|nr:Hypothetical protein R9X50_00101000 [Acrodontium crateriforme]